MSVERGDGRSVWLPCRVKHIYENGTVLVTIDMDGARRKVEPVSVWTPKGRVILREQALEDKPRLALKGLVNGEISEDLGDLLCVVLSDRGLPSKHLVPKSIVCEAG